MNAAQFQTQTDVSRETLARYQTWFDLLSRWNKKINLVAPTTLHDFWHRHALDSWQVVELLPPNIKTVLDMGAGAGFPGLAMAIGLADKPGAHITLIEANGKKCNFLRTVIRELALPAKAVQERVENLPPAPYDIITARAFAPLPKLLAYSQQFWGKQTTALFPKGAHWQDEVKAAQDRYDFTLTATPSQTAENAKILTIKNLTGRANKQ